MQPRPAAVTSCRQVSSATSPAANRPGIEVAVEFGAFIHTIALPVGVAVGAHVVEAESGEHVVSGPPMLISGTPMTPDDQDTRLEEGDSLLAQQLRAS